MRGAGRWLALPAALAASLWVSVATAPVQAVSPGSAATAAGTATVAPPTYAGDYGRAATAELSPVDQVADAAGNWYVVDEGLQCVKVYRAGVRIRSIFTCGVGGKDNTHIRRARGMGFDRVAQALWIADTTNNRVLKVALDGRVLAVADASGAPGGPFLTPADVTVDDGGAAYVVDNRNRVVKLAADGTFVAQWGSTGRGVGQMSAPLSIHHSSVGTSVLYVTDAQNGRLVKWSNTGRWLGTLGSPGTGVGQFSKQPRGVTVDAAGIVYAADVGGNRINRYDRNGAVLPALGTGLPYRRTGPTDLFYGARGLWVNGTTLAVADMWNYRLLLWNLDGTAIGQIGGSLPPVDGHVDPHGVAVDAAGNVYVSDYWHQYIQKFAADGTFLARWGIGRGSEPGTLNFPGGIDVDDRGRYLYIANREERAVDRWRLSDGAFDRRFEMPVSAAGPGWPRDVAVNETSGLLYAADDKGRQVVVFDVATGAVVRTIATYGSAGTSMGVPNSVAVDESGNLYVADATARMIHTYTAAGAWVRDRTLTMMPQGVTVRAGVLYVLGYQVRAYSLTGGLLYQFGSAGTADSRLHGPYVGIEVGPDKAVYVGDSGVGRVKVFRHH